MDLRKWLLLHNPPASKDLELAIQHIPCSNYRSPSVMRLFASGYRTGFKLTDGHGQPTESLHMMARIMDGVDLCQLSGLPREERRGFGFDGPELVNTLSNVWYLHGITERVKAAQSAFGYAARQWIWSFFPRLKSATVSYRDPDGKTRRRVCYIAPCVPNWEMQDDVYEGLWRFTYEHREEVGAYFYVDVKPDGYRVLDADPALKFPGGHRINGRDEQALCASATAPLQTAVGCT